jgi:class 3 adenylate cyclase
MNNFALAEHLHVGAGIDTGEAVVGNVVRRCR